LRPTPRRTTFLELLLLAASATVDKSASSTMQNATKASLIMTAIGVLVNNLVFAFLFQQPVFCLGFVYGCVCGICGTMPLPDAPHARLLTHPCAAYEIHQTYTQAAFGQ
jgi:hypothetical protein